MNRFSVLFLMLVFSVSLNAQEFSYGFKVGLNFSTLLADSEMDADGNSLETFDYNSGFHVGAAVIYRFTDLVGVKAELLFNQRGVKYAYDGSSFQIFTDDQDNQILSTGNRKFFLETVNSYIDIPLTAYYKIGSKLEVYGGVDIGFLVGSSGVGEYTYTSSNVPGFPDVDEVFELDYNYYGDDIAANTPIDAMNTDVVTIANNTRTITIPEKLGAYYLDYDEKDGSFYNVLDFGLTGGLAFYINSGLYISGTANYSLTDATNNFYDVSRTESNGLEYISRDDKDTNLSFQASIGFSF